MTWLALGVTVEPWAKGVLSVAFSIGLVVAVVGGGLFLLGIGAKQVLAELRATLKVIHELEEDIQDQRETTVPALATFIGTVGVAISTELVPPPVGVGVSVLGAMVTFAGATLARNPDYNLLLRWVYGIGAMAPFAASTVAIFVSGEFTSFSLAAQIVLSAGLVVGVIGLTGVVAAALKPRAVSPSPAAS